MNRSRWAWIALLVVLASEARAQNRIETTVISVSGRSVYFAAGREAGVRSGYTVFIFLANGSRVETTIQDVSSSNSRADLRADDLAPEINARAEVLIPALGKQDEPTTPEPAVAKPVPAHPPWTRPPEKRNPDTPLLAPAYATSPEQRPRTFHGRIFSIAQFTRDNENQNEYSFGRLGTSMELSNPFHRSDRLLFSGEIQYRGANLFDGTNREIDGRIDRLSYAWGLDEHAPYRAEIGRFYSTSLPELGLFDGAEVKARFDSGVNLGAGVGMYPASSSNTEKAEDVGFHLFADYEHDRKGSLSSAVGYLQTWHNGNPDRNLLIGRVNTRPIPALWLYAMAMVDLYGPDSPNKGLAGLTQALAQATLSLNDKTGISTTYVHTSWPELLRTEYRTLPTSLVRDGHVDRISGSAWRKIVKDVRLTGRMNYWVDQNGDGYGGELGVDWTNVWHQSAYLHSSIYVDKSAFTDGLGGRLQARHDFGAVQVSAGYDFYSYTVNRVQTGSERFIRHTIRTDVGWTTGTWYYNVDASYNVGDNENSISLGLFVEYRF